MEKSNQVKLLIIEIKKNAMLYAHYIQLYRISLIKYRLFF